MSVATISDPSIKLRPSKKLLQLVHTHAKHTTEIPGNVAKALKHSGYSVPQTCEVLEFPKGSKSFDINMKLLADLCGTSELANNSNATTEQPAGEAHTDTKSKSTTDVHLNLSDLRWLTGFLAELRKSGAADVFLHDVIETCSLELPRNEVIERNPELEARCQKLREMQLNREYRKMTKDVDAGIKNAPEDTFAYQVKAINSQIIAVLQFVFSVVAGFVFGFLGIELIVGNLEFGFRLLLGIIFALIIALAEIYFLAKKLNEYDMIPDLSQTQPATAGKHRKQHAD